MPISETYNLDVMEYLQTMADKSVDLALVDPPYGIGEDGKSNHSRGGHSEVKKTPDQRR